MKNTLHSTPTPRPACWPTRLAVAALAVSLAACSTLSEREQGTVKGAAIGTAAGAIIGSATGGSAGRSAVLGGVLGAAVGNLWTKRLEDKREALERASAGTGVAVERTPDNRLKLNVPTDVSFDIGRADIKPSMRPVLDELARNPDAGTRIQVVGHTDADGSDAYNQNLSVQRAQSVRDYLIYRGLPASRISAVGRGEMEPVAGNDSASGREKNRRVEIFLAEAA